MRAPGVRHFRPYASADAALFAEMRQEQLAAQKTHLFPSQATWTAPDLAGLRRSASGTYGRPGDEDFWQGDIRQVLTLLNGGGRGPGLDPRYDLEAQDYQTSGRLEAGSISGFSQKVRCENPVLRLVVTGGEARVRVTAGSSMGGASDSRECFLGGGFTFTSDVSSWDVVEVQVLQTTAAAELQFAWLSGQSAAANQDLFLVQNVAAAVQRTTPNGAYEVTAQNVDGGFLWNNDVIEGVVGSQTFAVALAAGTPSEVYGFQYTPLLANRLMWRLRPL